MVDTDAAFERRKAMILAAPLFSGLPRDTMVELARRGTELVLPRRRVLDSREAETTVLLIGSGRVRVVARPDVDVELTLSYRHAGDLVWVERLVEDGALRDPRALHVIEAAQCVRLPVRPLERLMEANPAFASALLAYACRDVRALEARLTAVATQPVERRIARFLLSLEPGFGVPRSDGVLLGVRLTHAELADYVIASRETVTVVLNAWKRSGIVAFDQRHVVLRDAAALQRLAG